MLKTVAELDQEKFRIPIDELSPGDNYKNVTREATDRIKRSMLEEIALGSDPQVTPLLVDARAGSYGKIIGGNHQYFAIKELIKEGKWPYENKIKVEVANPKDDKHAKMLALKHNTQYDIATKERLAEWGAVLVESGYALSDIPVMTDIPELTLLDVMDYVSPSEKEEINNITDREKEVKCPNCGHSFYV